MTGISNVYLLTPEQVQRALALCWKAKVPVAIVGGVGCGKTTAMHDFVDKLNGGRTKGGKYRLWTIILSYLESSDIGGIPTPDGSKAKYLMPEFLPFDSDEHGVIFGDEFDRATPEVQNAFLQVLLGNEFHGHRLSENAFTVLAMNGASDLYTTPLSRAARTRICSLFISRFAEGAGDSYQNWAERNGIDPLTRAFAKFRPELYEKDEQFEELAQCTPRTVDMVGKVMEAARDVKFKIDDILPAVVAGIIGRKAATEYMAIQELLDKAPTPEEIIADPMGCKIPEDPSVCHAMTSGLVAHCSDRKQFAAAVKYAVRLQPEWAAHMLKTLSKKEPQVVTVPEFCTWKNSHAALLL
jgi:hypothetical protein